MKLPFVSSYYKEGYTISLENAKALLRVSQKSAEICEYGIACSLNTLAGEEAIKAVVILTKHYFPLMKTSDFKDMFSYHKRKHQGLMTITFLSKYMIDYICDSYERDKDIFDAVEKLSIDKSNEIKTKYKYLYKSIEFDKKNKIKSEKFDNAIKWCNQANDDKKKGYV